MAYDVVYLGNEAYAKGWKDGLNESTAQMQQMNDEWQTNVKLAVEKTIADDAKWIRENVGDNVAVDFLKQKGYGYKI